MPLVTLISQEAKPNYSLYSITYLQMGPTVVGYEGPELCLHLVVFSANTNYKLKFPSGHVKEKEVKFLSTYFKSTYPIV